MLPELGEGPVDFGELQLREEVCGFEIAHRVPLFAKLVRQDTSEKGFAHAGWPHQDEVEMLGQPESLSPFEELGFLQPSRDVKIHLVQGGGTKEPGLLKTALEPLVLSSEIFPFHQQGEALIKGEVVVGGRRLLFLPGFKNPHEFEGFQLVYGGLHGTGERWRSVIVGGAPDMVMDG